MTCHTRSELNAIARKRKILFYYDFSVHRLRAELGLGKPIVRLPTEDYTKG